MPGTAPTGTERRLALVIGNRAYTRAGASLTNSGNDADDMAAALDGLGFTIIKKKDLDRVSFEQTVDEFGRQLKNYDVGLFYYSGHGLQYQGDNYLVPTDENMTGEPQIRYHCVDMGRVQAAMEGSGAPTNIMMLDACRSNPFPKSSKGPLVGGGLTIPRNPAGTIVVFATSANSTADDNPSARNGLFTSELLKYIRTPNRSLGQILTDTRRGVYTRSNKQQTPADYNQLLGDFVFVKTASQPVSVKPSRSEPANPVPIVERRTEPGKPVPVADLPVGPAMVYVKGGSFSMGSNESDDEKPIHEVRVSDFLMGKYEVTVGEFEQFVEATNYQTDADKDGGSYVWTGSKYKKKSGVNWRCDVVGSFRSRSEYRHPVIHVSHNDAVAYCAWLSRRAGKAYRLPTEAEWEYGAGNGSAHTKYSWRDGEPARSARGNVDGEGDSYKHTVPVGSYAPNQLGLYDMSGNVWEWCADWYDKAYYANSGSVNPTGPGKGATRVIRGGSWYSPPKLTGRRFGATTPPRIG